MRVNPALFRLHELKSAVLPRTVTEFANIAEDNLLFRNTDYTETNGVRCALCR